MFLMNQNDFLKSFPTFGRYPVAMIKEIVSSGTVLNFSAGRQIYSEGDACAAIAFVLDGEVRVYKTGQSGREITLYEIGSGETCILNASCLLSGTSYPAHAVTSSKGSMLLVPAPDFRRMMAAREEMRDFVFTLLSRRLSLVMELVEEVAFGRMDQRLMDYLVEKSADNRLETTHQKIANDLGTSREVVSRLLKDFERKNRVSLSRNSITILRA
jgi:CRP/FNR family transcriptional regulator